MNRPRHRRVHSLRRSVAVSACAALALSLAACSSDGGDDDSTAPSTTAAAAETTTTSEPAGPAPITILVSNDDGYEAGGINALVEGLSAMDGVEVVVYAPLTQQSGTGGTSTEGELEVTDVELKGGHPAKAVAGFPADTIRVAMDEDGVEPDIVISGINEGQNLGPIVDISGTVGAARAAVARGVPALATSSGSEGHDVEAAVPFIVEWVTEQRDAIAAGDLEVQVWNLNSPTCTAGEIRGLLEVESGADQPPLDALTTEQDCSSTQPESELTNDVVAFNAGFVTLTVIPDEPVKPAEVVPAA